MIENLAVRRIVEQLTAERLRRGWTQDKIAQVCGASGADISRWEKGITVPMSPNLARWATALSFSLEAVPIGAPQYVPIVGAGGERVMWMHECGAASYFAHPPTENASCYCGRPSIEWVQVYRKATAGELG